MTCTFCGSRNPDGEHRCRRCGRRPEDTAAAFALHTAGALAAAPKPAPEPSRPLLPDMSRAVQRPLFQDRPAPNVIPFESYGSPAAPKAVRTAPRHSTRRTASRVSDAQANLDFLPAAPDQPRTLGTTVEAMIVCDAPVATPLHRGVAAALDWSMVLIGYGLFLLAFSLAGGQFVLSKPNLMIFGAVLALIAFTYGLFWSIAGAETAGMRWTRLRLTTFEGFPPEPRHRVMRFAGSCLSFCTIVGLLWSLADEESLNWQDHISRTFPTPLDSDSKVFHRK